MTIIGTCSICGGNVYVPDVWMGVVPPEPTCMSCGAVRKKNVIEMQPVKRQLDICGAAACKLDGKFAELKRMVSDGNKD